MVPPAVNYPDTPSDEQGCQERIEPLAGVVAVLRGAGDSIGPRAFGAGCNSRPVVGPGMPGEPTSRTADDASGAWQIRSEATASPPEPTVQSG